MNYTIDFVAPSFFFLCLAINDFFIGRYPFVLIDFIRLVYVIIYSIS